MKNMIDLKALLLDPEQKFLPSGHNTDIIEIPGNLGTLRIDIEWINISTRDTGHDNEWKKRKVTTNIVLYQNRLLDEGVPYIFKSPYITDDLIIYVKNTGRLYYQCYIEPQNNIDTKNLIKGGIVKPGTKHNTSHHDPEVISPIEELKKKLSNVKVDQERLCKFESKIIEQQAKLDRLTLLRSYIKKSK